MTVARLLMSGADGPEQPGEETFTGRFCRMHLPLSHTDPTPHRSVTLDAALFTQEYSMRSPASRHESVSVRFPIVMEPGFSVQMTGAHAPAWATVAFADRASQSLE